MNFSKLFPLSFKKKAYLCTLTTKTRKKRVFFFVAQIMKRMILLACLLLTIETGILAAIFGKPVTWDKYSLIIDGQRVCPVMGEVHYSRIPADEWQREVKKMKDGGVTIVATYVFWNHIEEEEGIFRWDGQRSLRRFLEVCREQQMPVVLRLGPFCHGEVYQGGFPVWIVEKAQADPKNYKLRSTAPGFLAATKSLCWIVRKRQL